MSETAAEYLDLSALAASAEVLPEDFEIESPDYSDKSVPTPGDYISQSRTIKGRQQADGHFSFTVEFNGGLQSVDQEGRVVGGGKFPLKTYFSTRPFQAQDRPGKTSGVAEYLRKVGFEPKGMSVEEMLSAVVESQSIPVKVYLGLTDKGKKQPDGSYTQKNLKTKDFNVGTKEAPLYRAEVTIDGEVFEARPKVSGWKKLQ